MIMTASATYFASCPKGVEGLLLDEIKAMGITECKETVAGIYFTGPLESAYRVCLWSRLANKVFLPVNKGTIKDAKDVYELAMAVPWEEHLSPEGTFLVDFSGTNHTIRNSQFGALTIKDAIVDRMREKANQRPSVSKEKPDLRVNARLNRGQLVISLDLAGESLHRRGYRLKQGAAPLKENLAAAILTRAGWLETINEQAPLLDPMCGSGTILIEAAFMALDRAPGLDRPSFGFERWLNHPGEVWAAIT